MKGRDELAPWRWLLRAHAAVIRAIEADLAERNVIPLAWYDVLLELNSAPGRRLRMSELGERVVLSRTRVSRIVDELEHAGLVERVANPDDRRSSFAHLTAKGRAELKRAAPHYLAGIDRHYLSLLDATEHDVLASALERVARSSTPTSNETRGADPRTALERSGEPNTGRTSPRRR